MDALNLKKIDPCQTGRFEKKESALEVTEKNLGRMRELLYLLFAESRHSLLVILQGLDASGKDGTIKHIFSGANPQGVIVHSFKEPTPQELRHDFLWRSHVAAPEAGFTAIFNRSYYEEVTTVMVHRDFLKQEHLPEKTLSSEDLFDQRYGQINGFEKMLAQNGTVILKFLLHISKKEQKKRLQERLKDPLKKWKFSPKDLKERKYREQYMNAFNKMLKATHTSCAPWHVIPADKKWYRNYLVSKIITDTLETLGLRGS